MSARNRSKSLSVQGFLTVIFLLVGLLVCNGIILADNVADDDEIIVALETAYQREIGYAQYIAGFEDAPKPEHEIIIRGSDYSAGSEGVHLIENLGDNPNPAVCTTEVDWVEWEIEIPEAGLYNIEIKYYPIEGRSSNIERELWINGERPFSEAAFFTFFRVWGDAHEIRVDNMGNQVRARQIEKPRWEVVPLRDAVGYIDHPLYFYFEEGTNTIRLSGISEPLAIEYIRLYQHKETIPYVEVKKIYEEQGYKVTEGFMKKVQGEESILRSSPTLFPDFDQGDPTVEPYHPAQIRLNSIGGHRWKNFGEWIEWEVEVPESGLYQIAFKAKQNQNRGTYSNRRLYVNGEVPFQEASILKFPFSSHYQMHVIGKEYLDEPALVYLEEGTNIIRLEIVLGPLAALLQRTEDVLYELNTIYRRIIMITTSNPDPFRSYELHRRIPGLIERLGEIAEIVEEMEQDFFELTGQRGGHTDVLANLARMLRDMHNSPRKIPTLLGEFRDHTGSLGTWIWQTREQPLTIDYFIVSSIDQELPRAEPTAWDRLKHEVRAFIASFTHDYSRIGDFTDPGEYDRDRVLKVWIGSGRDQAQILKQMIEDSFTPESGITVELELIQDINSLMIPAIIAGTAPDVALGSSNMDMAFRGALQDLRMFEDFDEVAQRFMKSAFVPFTFRGGVYALPEIQGFNVLFYREDVLKEIGVEIPQTWDDVISIIPILHDHNLEMGIGADMLTFLMFLYQKGVALHKEDVIETNLDSEIAIQTFKELTYLYTHYELPLVYNIENRFRLGEMPLVITSYGLFNTLTVFAPELRGEWGFTLVPGTPMEDGTINRAVPVYGAQIQPGVQSAAAPATSGAVILEGSKMKNEAWEFLKWWTRTDTQVRFGRELEALMGSAARYPTANVEAMQQLPWRASEREVLLEQWHWVEGVPAVLGAYYVQRQFDWMFRAVVLQNAPLRETIMDYNRAANDEIKRKREEFGLETSIDELSDEIKEMYWSMYTHVYRLD